MKILVYMNIFFHFFLKIFNLGNIFMLCNTFILLSSAYLFTEKSTYLKS